MVGGRRLYSIPELVQLVDVCLAHDFVICSDDIHKDLLLGGARYTPLAGQFPEISERTITFISPGKAFNASELGCAFAIVAGADLRGHFAAEVARLTLVEGFTSLKRPLLASF